MASCGHCPLGTLAGSRPLAYVPLRLGPRRSHMTTPSGEPIFPRLRPDEPRRPSTAVIATSALALILVIILAIVLVTRNTGASKDDLVKAAQQATDQAQAAQDVKGPEGCGRQGGSCG